MKIALASDHAAFAMKEFIKSILQNKNIEYKDFGTHSEESCDYPDYGKPAAESVASGECDRGIFVCGTGLGMSMVANKVKGIRATLCHNEFTAEMSRKHNDSNVLVVGARVIDNEMAERILNIWLETEFERGRHQRRVDKIED